MEDGLWDITCVRGRDKVKIRGAITGQRIFETSPGGQVCEELSIVVAVPFKKGRLVYTTYRFNQPYRKELELDDYDFSKLYSGKSFKKFLKHCCDDTMKRYALRTFGISKKR